MGFVWFSRQTRIISLNSINKLIFAMETCYIFFLARTECLSYYLDELRLQRVKSQTLKANALLGLPVLSLFFLLLRWGETVCGTRHLTRPMFIPRLVIMLIRGTVNEEMLIEMVGGFCRLNNQKIYIILIARVLYKYVSPISCLYLFVLFNINVIMLYYFIILYCILFFRYW
jgi:hypothetical protein